MGDATLFDADVLRASLTPPRYKMRGREQVGQFLSHAEYLVAVATWSEFAAKGATEGAFRGFLLFFFDVVFPPSRLARLVRRCPGWLQRLIGPRSVADDVLSLTWRRQQEVVGFFLNCLAHEHVESPANATEATRPTSGTTTVVDGSDSRPATSSPDFASTIPAST